jgi:hypothetical protein
MIRRGNGVDDRQEPPAEDEQRPMPRMFGR